jgi:hypothetical protein
MKMGAPRKEIDWDAFEKLAKMQCTESEMCSFFEICEDTLNTRCKEMYGKTFSDTIKRYSDVGKMSVRRGQFRRVEEGSDSMIIFLSKTLLGMKETNVIESYITITPADVASLDPADASRELMEAMRCEG